MFIEPTIGNNSKNVISDKIPLFTQSSGQQACAHLP